VKILDISLPLSAKTPTWPGSPEFRLQRTKRLDGGDNCNSSYLHCDTHMGTHVDAPSHFLKEGATIEELSLDSLVGPAVVGCLPDVSEINASDLGSLRIPRDTKRLLLRTRNSEFWSSGERTFRKDFVALTPEAARWIADRGMYLVGIDYLSVQRYEDSPATHRILLEANVVILEGLNLIEAEPGTYELICLPICLVGAEGAPARAVLRRPEVCRRDRRNPIGDCKKR